MLIKAISYASLYRLGLDYVDLYLIHSPSGGKVLETWDTLIELQKQGFIKYSLLNLSTCIIIIQVSGCV